MIHNSAADCSISLKFAKESEHVTPDLQQAFNVEGPKLKVTA